MIILLREQFFEQLFSFLEALDRFVASRSSPTEKSYPGSSTVLQTSEETVAAEGALDQIEDMDDSIEHEDKPPLLPLMESRVEFLCGITWELLFLLPTNQSILNKLNVFLIFLGIF